MKQQKGGGRKKRDYLRKGERTERKVRPSRGAFAFSRIRFLCLCFCQWYCRWLCFSFLCLKARKRLFDFVFFGTSIFCCSHWLSGWLCCLFCHFYYFLFFFCKFRSSCDEDFLLKLNLLSKVPFGYRESSAFDDVNITGPLC